MQKLNSTCLKVCGICKIISLQLLFVIPHIIISHMLLMTFDDLKKQEHGGGAITQIPGLILYIISCQLIEIVEEVLNLYTIENISQLLTHRITVMYINDYLFCLLFQLINLNISHSLALTKYWIHPLLPVSDSSFEKFLHIKLAYIVYNK